jgi:hypothetical protein
MNGDTRPAWLDEQRRSGTDPVKIALGVAAGILAAGAIAFFARLWLVNHVVGQMNEAVMTINKQTQQQIERERERAAAAQAAARQQEAERKAMEAAVQRARELEAKETVARQTQKRTLGNGTSSALRLATRRKAKRSLNARTNTSAQSASSRSCGRQASFEPMLW